METTTKQDKLIFFFIAFAWLYALAFIFYYLNPVLMAHTELFILTPLLLSVFFTFIRFDWRKISKILKNQYSRPLVAVILAIIVYKIFK
jgi:hypothetical protein